MKPNKYLKSSLKLMSINIISLSISLVLFLKLYSDYSYLQLLLPKDNLNLIIVTSNYKSQIINSFMSLNYEYILGFALLFLIILVLISDCVDFYSLLKNGGKLK